MLTLRTECPGRYDVSTDAAMKGRLWFDLPFRRRVREEVRRLHPWYQTILLPGLILTRPLNRETIAHWCNGERGGTKWRRHILPVIGPYLKDATVVELGCNAGQLLTFAIRAGAAEVWGIEPDDRYRAQALLVRQCLGLQRQMTIMAQLPPSDILPDGRRADIGLLCAVLRHVPETERVYTLERMGTLCERILIQGNGFPDAPDGDSAQSIIRCIDQAGLHVEQMRCIPHCRGLTILARAT